MVNAIDFLILSVDSFDALRQVLVVYGFADSKNQEISTEFRNTI